LDTNLRVKGAVSDVEVRRAKLDWERAVLSIEKAGHDQELAKFEAYSKLAELKAADLAIGRRKVIAPFDGEIIELNRKQDEWVNPGDPILRLVRRDVMHVEGAVLQSEYDPDELQDRDVTVTVQLARGQSGSAPGRIVYVSPYLRGDGKYVVRAEVANTQNESGNWILMDGQTAQMTIHVDAASPAAEISRKP
jgi:multidrug efflux pump subunit AcrA (membrane-fusion protein)